MEDEMLLKLVELILSSVKAIMYSLVRSINGIA